MFEFLVCIQALSIILLLAEIVYMVPRISSKLQALMFLFVLEILINNIGYMLELLATTADTAIMGTRISYIGKAYFI
ncbi:MAG: hypothetical protein IJW18_07390, partial [Lachnospiraceae bacterium]|nr:hypothetical protein [Lachnospiraceae bacterium]